MKKTYTFAALAFALLMSLQGTAQTTKVKTITIINGDTTITEKEFSEKELADKKREHVIINEDREPGKKVVKKIIIDEKNRESEATAYAYSFDELNEDIEMSTSEDGSETRIIVRRNGKDGDKREKVVERKPGSNKNRMIVSESNKERLRFNINVSGNKATISYESSSKDAIHVSVLDEAGKQVFHDSKNDGGNYTKELPLEKKGTYFLTIIQNKQSTQEKIVIE